jgi:hypothetical protein
VIASFSVSGLVPMSAAIAGSEVAMTVESMFSMNRAVATMSGIRRSLFMGFGGIRGKIEDRAVPFSRGRGYCTRRISPSFLRHEYIAKCDLRLDAIIALCDFCEVKEITFTSAAARQWRKLTAAARSDRLQIDGIRGNRRWRCKGTERRSRNAVARRRLARVVHDRSRHHNNSRSWTPPRHLRLRGHDG